MSRAAGVSERQLIELVDFETSDAFSPVERAVLRLATQMTSTPAEVSDDVFDALRPDFTPPQLVELVSAIAWESYRARFNRALGIEAEGYSEGSFCVRPVHLSGRGPWASESEVRSLLTPGRRTQR